MHYKLITLLLLPLVITSICNANMTKESVLEKADQEGGMSLTLEECKMVGSRYSSIDSDGNAFTDGGFHCAYISKANEKIKLELLKKKYKDFKGTLEELCTKINHSYIGDSSKSNFDHKSLECSTKSKEGQKEYELMKPFFEKQHLAVLEERKKIIEQRRVEEEKNKALAIKKMKADEALAIEKRKDEVLKEQQKEQERKANILPIKMGIEYKCEGPIFQISSLSANKNTLTISTFFLIETNDIILNSAGAFNEYILYRGLDAKGNIYSAKLLNKSGINGSSTNLELKRADQYAHSYYCIQK